MPFAVSSAQLPRGNLELNTNYMFLVLGGGATTFLPIIVISAMGYFDTLGDDGMAQWLRVLPALAEVLSLMPSTHLAGVSRSPVSTSLVFVGACTHVHMLLPVNT